jgi:hypothetical protein
MMIRAAWPTSRMKKTQIFIVCTFLATSRCVAAQSVGEDIARSPDTDATANVPGFAPANFTPADSGVLAPRPPGPERGTPESAPASDFDASATCEPVDAAVRAWRQDSENQYRSVVSRIPAVCTNLGVSVGACDQPRFPIVVTAEPFADGSVLSKVTFSDVTASVRDVRDQVLCAGAVPLGSLRFCGSSAAALEDEVPSTCPRLAAWWSPEPNECKVLFPSERTPVRLGVDSASQSVVCQVNHLEGESCPRSYRRVRVCLPVGSPNRSFAIALCWFVCTAMLWRGRMSRFQRWNADWSDALNRLAAANGELARLKSPSNQTTNERTDASRVMVLAESAETWLKKCVAELRTLCVIARRSVDEERFLPDNGQKLEALNEMLAKLLALQEVLNSALRGSADSMRSQPKFNILPSDQVDATKGVSDISNAAERILLFRAGFVLPLPYDDKKLRLGRLGMWSFAALFTGLMITSLVVDCRSFFADLLLLSVAIGSSCVMLLGWKHRASD